MQRGCDRIRAKDRNYVAPEMGTIMLVVSLVAALFGFTDLAAASAEWHASFYIFLVIFLVLLVLGLMAGRAARGP